MTRSLLTLLIVAAFFVQAFAQKQSPSFIYQNHVISYNIVRYSPVWEIQDNGVANSEAVVASRLFRNVRTSETQALRSFLFQEKNEPADLKQLEGEEYIADLSSRRINIYYRIDYDGRQIYLATLNKHSSRSIVPFKEVNGRWELDTEFMNDPFFDCLQNNNFNPYTGEFTGRALRSYGFEELNAGKLNDHSGFDVPANAYSASITNGRVGSALQVKGNTKVEIPTDGFESGKQVYLDFHVNIGSALRSEAWRTIIRSDNNGMVIEYRPKDESSSEVRILLNGTHNSEILHELGSEKWYHLNIQIREGKATLKLDGSTKTVVNQPSILVPKKFLIQNKENTRFKLDELNIGI